MKNYYAALVITSLTFITTTVTAQLSIEPNPVYISVPDPSVSEEVAYSLVTNESDETKNFTWYKEEIELTEGWDCAICDINQCYIPGVYTQNFTLNAGQSGTLDVHIYPNEIEGGAIVRVLVRETDNPDNETEGFYFFNQSVSVAERLNQSIQLYPNPTTDQLFVEQSAHVSRIELFSLTGEQVVDADLNTEKVVSVGHLSTGTYVARLFDNNGKQVSSNVVIKK